MIPGIELFPQLRTTHPPDVCMKVETAKPNLTNRRSYLASDAARSNAWPKPLSETLNVSG